MKKILLFLLLSITGISFSLAENQENQENQKIQRYVVASKNGKTKFVPVIKDGDKWKWKGVNNDLYLENGIEVEGFEIKEDNSLNYKGSPYVYNKSLIAEYEGQHYVVVFAKKDLKPIDENGELTSGLGIRNYLSNTLLGDFYRTTTPGLIALLCGFISGLIVIVCLFKENVPDFLKWVYAVPLCVISLLEIGAAFSLGTEAAWWVNPDDVSYWIATPLLIPYAVIAAQMVFSYKLYGFVGHLDGASNTIISALLITGIVLTVISAIFVVINFLFAACMLIFAGWLFGGMNIKNSDDSTTNIGPLGSYKTDRYGNTTHIRN